MLKGLCPVFADWGPVHSVVHLTRWFVTERCPRWRHLQSQYIFLITGVKLMYILKNLGKWSQKGSNSPMCHMFREPNRFPLGPNFISPFCPYVQIKLICKYTIKQSGKFVKSIDQEIKPSIKNQVVRRLKN